MRQVVEAVAADQFLPNALSIHGVLADEGVAAAGLDVLGDLQVQAQAPPFYSSIGEDAKQANGLVDLDISDLHGFCAPLRIDNAAGPNLC